MIVFTLQQTETGRLIEQSSWKGRVCRVDFNSFLDKELVMDIELFDWVSRFMETHRSTLNNIFWIVVGAVLEPSIEKIGGSMVSNFKKRRQSYKTNKLCSELNDIENLHQVEILSTDDRPYDPKSIEVEETGRSFYIAFPKDLIGELRGKYGEEYEKYFEIHDDVALDGSANFESMAMETGIPNLQELIDVARHEVAEGFLNSNKGWHFNAGKYGVWDVEFARKWGEEESRSLQMTLYRTDYFTFNVTQKIYEMLKRDPGSRHIVDDMTTDITPKKLYKYRMFLSAFGVNAVVFLNSRTKGTVCILAERSILAADTPGSGVFHVTMNEGLTLIDKDNKKDKVRLSTCLRRGLYEELGLNDDVTTTRMKADFHDLFLVKSSYQLGISASVVLEDMDFEEFHGYWAFCAKDRNSETKSLAAINFDKKSIEDFLSRNEVIPYSKYIIALICAHKGVVLDLRELGWTRNQ